MADVGCKASQCRKALIGLGLAISFMRAINVSTILTINKTSQEIANITCKQHPDYFPAMAEMVKLVAPAFFTELFIWFFALCGFVSMYKTYKGDMPQKTAALRFAIVTLIQMSLQMFLFLAFMPHNSTMMKVAFHLLADDLNACPNRPEWLEMNIQSMVLYTVLFPVNTLLLMVQLVVSFEWHGLYLPPEEENQQRVDLPMYRHDLAMEHMRMNAFLPSYEEATSATALPSYETAMARAANVLPPATATVIPVDNNQISPVSNEQKTENVTTTYGATGLREGDVEGSEATSVSSFETADDGEKSISEELMTKYECVENNSGTPENKHALKEDVEFFVFFTDYFQEDTDIADTKDETNSSGDLKQDDVIEPTAVNMPNQIMDNNSRQLESQAISHSEEVLGPATKKDNTTTDQHLPTFHEK